MDDNKFVHGVHSSLLMLQSGKEFENIVEKFALLDRELELVGRFGLTNLHKHAENFVMRLLNLSYGYQLKNLNDRTATFPGLDLGDEKKSVGFQVSTQKDSAKVDDLLTKVIRYGHYTTFRNIFHFVLGKKQGSYSISTNTNGFFSFDPKVNIIDFTDLLKVIQQLTAEKLKAISSFVESEMPDFLSNISVNASGSSQEEDKATLIDIVESLDKVQMSGFEHWSMRVNVHQANFSVPELFRMMSNFYITIQRKNFLPIFNTAFQQSATSSLINYHQAVAGSVNRYSESFLQMKENSLILEYAQYQPKEDIILTTLNFEIGSLLSLLFMLHDALYKGFQVNLEIDLSTNGRLAFHPGQSIIQTQSSMSTHFMNPTVLRFSRVLTSIDNKTLVGILQKILDAFVGGHTPLNGYQPFLTLDQYRVEGFLNTFRSLHSKALNEL
jgi:hypothetical protein